MKNNALFFWNCWYLKVKWFPFSRYLFYISFEKKVFEFKMMFFEKVIRKKTKQMISLRQLSWCKMRQDIILFIFSKSRFFTNTIFCSGDMTKTIIIHVLIRILWKQINFRMMKLSIFSFIADFDKKKQGNQ